MRRRSHELDQVQRWMQAVIMHPEGVVSGIESATARSAIDVAPEGVEQVVTRSRNLTSIERLQVYANAYYARLLECLREEFPALAHALGEEAFDGFAFGYLQRYPSRSYTLAELARDFPQYLSETRPADEPMPSWPDFLIDLATVERTYSEVFSGPGIENQPALTPENLAAIPEECWPAARLTVAPCLRLLRLRYPVHEYISAVRHKEDADVPRPAATYLVVTRRDFVVRRFAVSQPEFELLSALAGGATIATATERIASSGPCSFDDPKAGDVNTLADRLRDWFQAWTVARLFVQVEVAL